MPVKRIERAGIVRRAFTDFVRAVTAVIRHALYVLATGAVRLGAQVTAIGVHDHAQGIGQFNPVERVHVDRQVPVANLVWCNAGQQRKVAGHHQPLNMVGIGMFQTLADRLADAVHFGAGLPVEL
ncbi:hypothetical protein D3C81_1674250 [compost metagenome]